MPSYRIQFSDRERVDMIVEDVDGMEVDDSATFVSFYKNVMGGVEPIALVSTSEVLKINRVAE